MIYFDEKLLKSGIKMYPDYENMIDKIKEETEIFCENFKDNAADLSQWGHHDFCAKDGGKLIFDVNNPTVHICEICGTNNESELLDGVWTYNYRNEAVLNIWKAATLYKVLKDEKYLNYIYKILGFYKDEYLNFKLHNKEGNIYEDYASMKWGAGRIMPQGLNEAIITIRILNALQLVKEDISKDFLQQLKVEFFDEVAKLLIPQVDKIHNISCWKNSAIGSIGLFYNDQQLIDFAFKAEFNITNQILSGVTKDYFWFEGSIHYNFFTLEGIINLLLFAELYDYEFDLEAKNIIEKMLVSAYYYAFDNLVLPNPNDGWPNINLKTYSYIYAIGSKVFGIDSTIANLYKNIELGSVVRTELPLSKPYYFNNKYSLERLILVPNIDLSTTETAKRSSLNFESSQYAILRNNRVNVFMKYGHNGPSHAHPDKMNIEVLIDNEILTRDLSNAGYGNKYCNEWHRVTPSHNTVVVNGQNQKSMEQGKTIKFTNDNMIFEANNVYGLPPLNLKHMKTTMNSDEVIKYLTTNFGLEEESVANLTESDQDKLNELVNAKTNNVNFIRNINLLKNGYTDKFNVTSTEDSVIDLFMHVEGNLMTKVNLVESTLNYEQNGYQHIANVRKVETNEEVITLKWRVGKLVLSQTIDLKDKALFLTETLDNPITKHRNSLVIRFKGNNTEFNQTWKVEE